MIRYTLHQLKNGAQVILAPMKETQAVTLLVEVKVGSRYETKEVAGISHFLEHLFFKGTKKRPSTLKIAKELDRLGAKYNAFTSEEITGFYIQAAAQDFAKIVEILADMIQNPLLAEKEIERERNVILEEMNMYFDTPVMYVQELAKLSAFGEIPLGQDIMGTRESVSQINRQALLKFRQTYYQPQNMIICVAGRPGRKDWLKELEKYFGQEVSQPAPPPPPYQKIPHSKRVVKEKKTDQVHLVVSALLPEKFIQTLTYRTASNVLSNLLGGQMSSRLFLKIRERRGLAYYVKTEIDSFKDVGLFTVSAGLKKSQASTGLKIILQEFNKVVHKLGREELQRAKENLRGRLALSLEDSMNIATFLSNQLHLLGKIYQPEEIVAATMKVDERMVKKIAREILNPQNLSLAAIGPANAVSKLKF